jgi:Protein of unknown function (DUF3089)
MAMPRDRQVARPAGTRSLTFAALVVVLPLLVGISAAPASASVRPLAANTSATVWLCRPGQALDPCAASRTATSVNASGSTSTQPGSVTSSSAQKFDCFYVYPTVSTQKRTNANLTVQPAEIAAAVAQASRFSSVCQVWAPMYRQATERALVDGQFLNPAIIDIAYSSLVSAWNDFVAHDDHGRPIVFIGHSQGAAMLIKLLQAQVDPSPTLRRRLVSAIILGGNVQVPTGKAVGGSFHNIPLCQSATQDGCVIAYSSFGSTPPADSLFGRAGAGVSLQSGQTSTAEQVACVNPVTFTSAAGSLSPYFLSVKQQIKGVTLDTPWATYPGLYTATCETSDGATWLQVTPSTTTGDPRPTVTATRGPVWGYHVDDVNLSLGNLVFDVEREEAAYH